MKVITNLKREKNRNFQTMKYTQCNDRTIAYAIYPVITKLPHILKPPRPYMLPQFKCKSRRSVTFVPKKEGNQKKELQKMEKFEELSI